MRDSERTEARPDSLRLDKDPRRIAGMFDAIAHRYDLLNHLLSVGLDQRWRRSLVATLDLSDGAYVVDVCTGTADLASSATVRPEGGAVEGVGGELENMHVL